MTAAISSVPISPTGPGAPGPLGAGAKASGPMAGFEALLATLFGAPDKPAAEGLFGVGKQGDDEAVESDASDAQPTAEAQALAALLAVPAPIQAVPLAVDGEAAPPASGAGIKGAPSPALLVPASTDQFPDQPESPELPGQNLAAAGSSKPLGAAQASSAAAPQEPAATPKPAAAPPPQPLAGSPAITPPAAETAALTEAEPVPTEPKPEPVRSSPRAARAEANRKASAEPALEPAHAPMRQNAPDPTLQTQAKTDAAAPDTDAPAKAPGAAEPKIEAPDPQGQAAAPVVADLAATHAAANAAVPVRGSPETVAHLAAQIVKKLDGRASHFDVELNPAGLGRVDVRIEIGAGGKMTAAMSFDTPQAAAELRGRAHELQQALEHAGFDTSGGLSFDVAGDRGQGGRNMAEQQQNNGDSWRGRAFQAALDTAGDADAAGLGALDQYSRRASGVDIRI